MNLPRSDHPLIEQGHCYLADMNPPRMSKLGKIRPVVVIQSGDTIKAGSPSVVIVPLTTNLREENILRVRLLPSHDLKLQKPSDVLLDQIHTIDRSLILEPLGPVPPSKADQIFEGIGFLLSIPQLKVAAKDTDRNRLQFF